MFATLFIAYSNSVNDNFKGVVTLFVSNPTNYKIAIWWATITTFIGSVFSMFLVETLIKSFSGKDLVLDVIADAPDFHIAVAISAAMTIIIATFTGFPISTTHVSVSSIVGVGIISKRAETRIFYQILLYWVLTLPTAAAISAIAYIILHT